MKVILIQDIKGTGKEGLEATVSDGYARNFLIPRKLAVIASPNNKKVWEKKRKIKEEQLMKERTSKQELADKLSAVTVVIKVDAGESGKLFGSVTSSDIALAVRDVSGIEVDKKDIVLADNIKGLGTYEVPIKLHPEVEAKVKVEVVAK